MCLHQIGKHSERNNAKMDFAGRKSQKDKKRNTKKATASVRHNLDEMLMRSMRLTRHSIKYTIFNRLFSANQIQLDQKQNAKRIHGNIMKPEDQSHTS